MSRSSGSKKGVKPSNFESITAEKYARILHAFLKLPNPTYAEIAQVAGVSAAMVKRAIHEGWPKLGLPPIPEAKENLVDPNEVVALMSGMADAKKKLAENFFGKLPGKAGEVDSAAVKAEATQMVAETTMATRLALSTATKGLRTAEFFAAQMLEKIQNGDFELPEKVRPEHIFLLAKAIDTANASVHKAIQAEKAVAPEKENVAGAQIAALLIGATPEEIRQIVSTGQIPPRLMGFNVPPPAPKQLAEKKDVIDVEVASPSKVAV